ncbi:MAG: hypothetical protein ACF8PN_08320 [Phycisphaerales bacterium]
MRRSRGVVLGVCGAIFTVGVAGADESIGPWELRAPDQAKLIAGGGPDWAYLNVIDQSVSLVDAFTGEPMLDDGFGNADAETIVQVGFDEVVTNGPGPDLVILEAQYDKGVYAISCNYDDFIAEATPTMIFTGEKRGYYYQILGHGPFSADIYGGEIDLSDLGVPDGDTIRAARFRTTNDACDPIALAAIARNFEIEVTGTCPGALTITANNATPNATVALFYARNTGSFTIPPGYTCSGTQLDLDSTVRIVQTAPADASGTAVFSGNVSASVCGGVVQAMDGTNCEISNVEGV